MLADLCYRAVAHLKAPTLTHDVNEKRNYFILTIYTSVCTCDGINTVLSPVTNIPAAACYLGSELEATVMEMTSSFLHSPVSMFVSLRRAAEERRTTKSRGTSQANSFARN